MKVLIHYLQLKGQNGGNVPESNVTVASAQLPGTMVLQRTFSPELNDPTSDLYREIQQLICQEVSAEKRDKKGGSGE